MSTACTPLSQKSIEFMQHELLRQVPGPKRRDGRVPDKEDTSRLSSLEWACVDQEVIVLYDPRVLADRPGRRPDQRPAQIPVFDFSGDPYYFRQASQLSVHNLSLIHI